MRQVSFKFDVHQPVVISAHSLNADGRVLRRSLTGTSAIVYSVEYCINGEIKSGEFYEDQLSEKSQ